MSQTRKLRKAVSPVVATLLLILIAISASIIIYAWVTGLSSAGKSTTLQTNERISVEAAKINTGASEIEVYIRNIGEAVINLSDIRIYVYNMTDGTLIGQATLGTTTQALAPGEVGSVTATYTFNLRSGEYYRVEVTLPSGFKDSIVVRAQ